jgi:hypothetical protein
MAQRLWATEGQSCLHMQRPSSARRFEGIYFRRNAEKHPPTEYLNSYGQVNTKLFFSAYAIKACRSGGTHALIRNLHTRWMQMVKSRPGRFIVMIEPRKSFNGRLGGVPITLSGPFWRKENLFPCPYSYPGPSSATGEIKKIFITISKSVCP